MSGNPHKPAPSTLQTLTGAHSTANAAATRRRSILACPTYPDPAATAELARGDAVALVGLVRDEDPRVVFGALQYYTHEQLAALAVALAAMVPPDRSAADLLAWLDPLATQEVA
ncbi:hypothetical protein [Kibdelosporangium phytohabitans]|uniref:Uncharacterized protein n=1 Tax=Kibdelosporangium phytohabitans TaxID=860235 RepID=A0A0N9HQ61_9PSEU|nr:hypothetical protein [Kibdelosporangium phytohabitans]ALG06833.1 hypothetical protein AOZ06_07730 [Kibdelosporangium phytohabitans]MBE1468079.1 hypothetical protein [Kibdelosporangium phytohabitans]